MTTPKKFYQRIYRGMWTDEKFRNLSGPDANAQDLWIFLLTGEFTESVPGIVLASPSILAERLRWPLKGIFSKEETTSFIEQMFPHALGKGLGKGATITLGKDDTITLGKGITITLGKGTTITLGMGQGMQKMLNYGLIDALLELVNSGMIVVDLHNNFIWVPNGIVYNPPGSINVIKSWQYTWDKIPECPLKVEIQRSMLDFLINGDYDESFINQFNLSCTISQSYIQTLAKGLAKGYGSASNVPLARPLAVVIDIDIGIGDIDCIGGLLRGGAKKEIAKNDLAGLKLPVELPDPMRLNVRDLDLLDHPSRDWALKASAAWYSLRVTLFDEPIYFNTDDPNYLLDVWRGAATLVKIVNAGAGDLQKQSRKKIEEVLEFSSTDDFWATARFRLHNLLRVKGEDPRTIYEKLYSAVNKDEDSDDFH